MPSNPQSWNRGAVKAVAICASCLALVLVSHYSASSTFAAPLHQRHVSRDLDFTISALNADEQCRQVHSAKDQCAFIHANCPRNDGGFSFIIDLYYCHWSRAKPVVLLALIAWLGLLFSTISVAASDYFSRDLGTLAEILGMSEALAGVTFLAFGNGSPDVFSTFAAMNSDSGSLAIGELFGAAGFISAVVSGSMAIIRPFRVPRKTFVRDVSFFAAAAGFSMVFLWDGRLHFWECVVMVVYYLAYVAFVVCWHMWVARKRRKRERKAAARGHFVYGEDEAELENEEYHEHGGDSAVTPLREDWSALERGEPDEDKDYETNEEEARDRWLSEYTGHMRLTRPATRARRNTNNPIRPSLMGALEFQAALRSLERSQNFQTIPMDKRRYSDTPTHTTTLPDDQRSTTSDPPVDLPPFANESSPLLDKSSNTLGIPSAPTGRARAVSANDATNLRLPAQFRPLSPVESEDNLIDLSQNYGTASPAGTPSDAQRPSPTVLIEPATPRREAPIQQTRGRSPTAPSGGGLLAPPDMVPVNRPHSDYFLPPSPLLRGRHSTKSTPQAVPRASELPRIIIPRQTYSPASSRSTSPFPAYRDHPSPSPTISSRSPSTGPPSLVLPDPIASPESIPADLAAERETPRRPTRLERMWPSSVLPPPGNMISALFPSFYGWKDKNFLARLVGVYAAPAVFFLTITLPVVESEEQVKARGSTSSEGEQTTPGNSIVKPANGNVFPDSAHPPVGILGGGSLDSKRSVTAVTSNMEQHSRTGSNPPQILISAEPEPIESLDATPVEGEQEPPELWDRWLTIIQLFLAPIFIVFAIYMQAGDDLEPSWLVKPILICLLISLVLLIPLLLTSTPTHRPACYRWILSAVGFIVAIAWISTVADQVVGALKALGVIINMSHAIMGLTIFAIGNSCGDLAANMMVASAGFPVMALSACFAGPMMNILLGIGLSGSYSLIRGEERRRHKHPEKGIRFHSFHIEVSKTLIVSGITLLITLVGLLIFVPLNKWVMDRKIGIGLIVLWTLSTVFNVVVEVTGVLDEVDALLLPLLGWLRA